MFKNIKRNLIALSLALIVVVGLGFVVSSKIRANSCDKKYGGGQDCDRGVKIKKEVRKAGESKFSEKVEDVKKGDVVVFRIVVTNTGDVDIDDLDVIDGLPEELEKLAGSQLDFEIDTLDNGDDREVDGCKSNSAAVKVFCIEARVKDSEFKKTSGEKCVVNVVKLKGDLDGDDEGRKTLDTDEAVVCYDKGEVLSALPKTGSEDTVIMSVYGLGMVLVGLIMKRFVKA